MSNGNSNVNTNANYASRNAGGPKRVFPNPNPQGYNPKGCKILPYDGLAHQGSKTEVGDVYSSWANKNNLGDEKKYKYWRTSKFADQKDIWGACKQLDRGGVLYKKCDHPGCKSLSNTDTVTNCKMNKHHDNINRPAFNKNSFTSLMGKDLDADGNERGTKLRDYYTYGTYSASGAFVPSSNANNMAPSGKSCNLDEKKDDYYGWMYQKRKQYTAGPGPQKDCGAKGYRFANGSTTDSSNNGKGAACGELERKYEDHNEQYLKDHYDQFKSGVGQPDQKLLDNYKSNFTLLGQGQKGTSDYMTFGGNVNPFKGDPRQRGNNAHIPSNTY
jgi:hypothetical protein